MTSSHQLSIDGVSVSYGADDVLHDLHLDIAPQKITSIVGPNGCGKSTLLKACARLVAPSAGAVRLDGEAIATMNTRSLARVLGLLPQHPIAPEGITVADLVGRGRHPHQRAFSSWSTKDYEVVADALERTGTADLADAAVDELSGGQRQRVWIALALAQETEVLLLDEPTTYLDVTHQLEVLDLVRELNHDRGITVVMVLHDLNLAARYSNQLIAVRDAAVQALGTPEEVLTESTVREVFDLEAQIVRDPVTETPMVVPIGRARGKARVADAATGEAPDSRAGSVATTKARIESTEVGA